MLCVVIQEEAYFFRMRKIIEQFELNVNSNLFIQGQYMKSMLRGKFNSTNFILLMKGKNL